MKLTLIKYDNANVLEATWYEEVDEVKQQVHCQAYADVQLDMLRRDSKKYGTSLDEYETLLAEVEANIVLPSAEEVAKQELVNKIAEAKAYLASTDFKMTIDYFATLTEIEQTGLTAKRAEARAFLKEQGL